MARTAILFAIATALAGGSVLTAIVATGDVADEVADEVAGLRPAGDWASDAIWHDGLVEKAVYTAEKVIYGQARQYEATFLTNKEQHDPATWTKSLSGDGVEVWKHNQIEVVPTPNYDYKFETTTHARVDDLSLTRLDAASQEWCGTTFHQYLSAGDGALDYFAFSYMPEQGRQSATVSTPGDRPIVAFNSLPLLLRGYDFEAREELRICLLPDQKSNKLVDHQPISAAVTFAGETDNGYRLTIATAFDGSLAAQDFIIGTFTFAKDRRHVMLSYEGTNGDRYTLKSLERVDYWTLPK